MSQQWPPQQPGPGLPYDPYAPSNGGSYRGPAGQNEPDAGTTSQYGQSDDWRPSYPPEAYLPGRPLPPGLPGVAAPPSQYGRGAPTLGYPSGGYAGSPSTFPPSEPEPERGWVAPLIIVLIIVIVMGSGGAVYALTRGTSSATSPGAPAATATNLPTVTPTPLRLPAGFVTYTDPAGNFRIFAPDGWQTQPSAPFVDFSSQADLAELSAGYEPSTSGPLDVELDAALSDIVSTDGGTLVNRQSPTKATLGGEDGTEVAGDWRKNGYSFHIVLIGATHKDGIGLVAYLAPQNAFTGIDDRFFHTMIESFTFLR